MSEINNVSREEISNVFNNHEVFISHRTTCGGGGVVVCVRKIFLPFISRIQSDMEECIFLRFDESVFDKSLIMAFPYIAHEGSVFYNEKMLNGIENFELTYADLNYSSGEVHWLICGDLNARTGNLDDTLLNNNINKYLQGNDDCYLVEDTKDIPCRKSKDVEINNFGRLFINFCKINDLVILNGRTNSDSEGKFTCIANGGRSIVDYFVTDIGLYEHVIDLKVIARPESDHFPLLLTLNCSLSCNECEQNADPINCTPIKNFIWNEKCKDQYNAILDEQFNYYKDELLSLIPINIDDAIEKFIECITYAAEYVQPQNDGNSNLRKVYQPPWWDKECTELKQNKYKKLNNFHNTGLEIDLNTYLDSKKIFKNACHMKKIRFDNQKVNDLISKFTEPNNRGFWGEIKTMLSIKSNNYKYNQIHPKEWLNHFKDLLGGENINVDDRVEIVETESYTDDESFDLLNGPILLDEVVSGIKSLKRGKAAGIDGIRSEFYQINNPNLITVIHKIICHIFYSGVYPASWSSSMITPLYKKGNASEVKNYRGINLINVMSKIFSHILQSRLKHWCEINNLIPEEQAGFRSNYSTVDNIFSLSALVQKYITKPRGRFYVLFVDFRVAFDNINRDKLWTVLKKDGCHGRMLNIIKSMYKNVMISIRVLQNEMTNCNNSINNENVSSRFCITECFKSMFGVKQGCILSPLLFNLYIAELKEHFEELGIRHVPLLTNDTSTSMLFYADDVAVFADTVFDMQKKIDMLYDFCSKWGLTVNLNKTKIMVFRNGGYLKSIEKWYYGGIKIDAVTYYSYLGMIFSSRLCWSKCLENHSFKALRMVGAMKKVFSKYRNIPIKIAFKIFDIKIKPMLLYGSQIWGCGYQESIERVHIKFCKAYLGVGKTTPNDLVLLECGRRSLSIDYNISVIKYWTKLIHMSEDRYPRKCYEQMIRHADIGRKNWVSKLKNVLYIFGFGNVWQEQQHLSDIKLFLYDMKCRLQDTDLQNLHSRISEKTDFYINFKSSTFYPSLCAMPYLTLNLNFSRRRIFTLLRTHSLPLKNNLLRWNIANNNLCEECSWKGVFVENEYHVLFRCLAYKALRQALIPSLYVHNPTFEKLHQLLTTGDLNLIDLICEFISKALAGRLNS